MQGDNNTDVSIGLQLSLASPHSALVKFLLFGTVRPGELKNHLNVLIIAF